MEQKNPDTSGKPLGTGQSANENVKTMYTFEFARQHGMIQKFLI